MVGEGRDLLLDIGRSRGQVDADNIETFARMFDLNRRFYELRWSGRHAAIGAWAGVDAVDERAAGKTQRGGVGQKLVVVGVSRSNRRAGDFTVRVHPVADISRAYVYGFVGVKELVLDVGNTDVGAAASKQQIRSDRHALGGVESAALLPLDLETTGQLMAKPLRDESLEEVVHVQHERRGRGVAVLVLQREVGQDQAGQPHRRKVVFVEPGESDPVDIVGRSFVGSRSGKNGTKWKRRRMAASIRAIDRSAVFMVPTNHRFSGSLKPSSGRYITCIDLSRYSSRNSSSPSTRGRLARLISSITMT